MATRISTYYSQRWNPDTKSFHEGSKAKTHVWSSFGCYDALSLEKKFCAKAGVPWRKLVDTQENEYLYKDKILKWRDSACREAFVKAKTLFLAKEQGRRCCGVKLPDPDLFLDKVDWDSNEDVSLMADLEEIESNIGEDHELIESIVVVPEQQLVPIIPVAGWDVIDDYDAASPMTGMIVGY